MTTYSYHIFYFPFKWGIKGIDVTTLSERIDFAKINFKPASCWERGSESNAQEKELMYNEKNYYYKFVHNVLYDNCADDYKDNIILHFERKECKVSDYIYYLIKVKQREEPFKLKVDSININLYSTGVGFLSFYLENNEESQSDQESVLLINQYGRRILPPFYDDTRLRNETSEYISIEGLSGDKKYKEDFNGYKTSDSWKQASFLNELIADLSDNLTVEPAIDDRMFVASWYKNDELADVFKNYAEAYKKDVIDKDDDKLSEKEKKFNNFSKFWYRYLFVDGGWETCQNNEMKEKYLEEHSYVRWQKMGSLYGCSRYSLVYLVSDECPDFLLKNFETIYARMVELVLVQRISVLRFSEEVTNVSNLNNREVKDISLRVSSLYKEYIRFINQIYFRSVTAQDQGIELYAILQNNLRLMEHLKDLDGEIQELFNYISLREDRINNEKVTFLNNVAIFFVPVSFITGLFGMNNIMQVIKFEGSYLGAYIQAVCIVLSLLIPILFIYSKKKRL